MSGERILAKIQEVIFCREKAEIGYDNYQYPDQADSYDNNDKDDSDSENE